MKSVKITGGGAKSVIWAQRCGLFKSKLKLFKVKRTSYGAAILAMVGMAIFFCEEACEELIKIKQEFYPNSEFVNLYNQNMIYIRKYIHI